MNGLDINLQQFRKMKAIDRDELMYKNLLHIKNKQGNIKLTKILGLLWLFLLTVALGFRKYLPI